MQRINNNQEILAALRDGLCAVLAEKLYGVYAFGAIAFPETTHSGDIDLYILLTDPPDASECQGIDAMHQVLARDHPPLGAELDAYYILLQAAQLSTPPTHLLYPGIKDLSWALHRAHMRAGRCIIVQGPNPKDVFPEPTWGELDQALQYELNYVEQVLEKYPAYCILNLCRIAYSYETRDVVTSKAAAAIWAKRDFSTWGNLIEQARQAYATQGKQDELFRSHEVHGFYQFICQQIGKQ